MSGSSRGRRLLTVRGLETLACAGACRGARPYRPGFCGPAVAPRRAGTSGGRARSRISIGGGCWCSSTSRRGAGPRWCRRMPEEYRSRAVFPFGAARTPAGCGGGAGDPRGDRDRAEWEAVGLPGVWLSVVSPVRAGSGTGPGIAQAVRAVVEQAGRRCVARCEHRRADGTGELSIVAAAVDARDGAQQAQWRFVRRALPRSRPAQGVERPVWARARQHGTAGGGRRDASDHSCHRHGGALRWR